MPSTWANFDHMFAVFQDLFYAFPLQQKDALGARMETSFSQTKHRILYNSETTQYSIIRFNFLDLCEKCLFVSLVFELKPAGLNGNSYADSGPKLAVGQ